jgi:uncharacterized protein with ParB-like and HNH nuclease domain
MALQMEEIQSEFEDQREDISPYKIISYPADYTLKGLYDKWVASEIYIPPFQRRYVWTITQASSLIESFLLGLPVPAIFLYRDRTSQRLLVIDGQQRLRSVFGYFEGKMPDTNQRFSLRSVKSQWDGLFFENLSSADQIRLKDSVLRAIIVEQIDPHDDTSMFHIFKRLNTGGTTLTPQEIRNALYQGPFLQLLDELNESEQWRKTILGATQPDKRMRDVELILRHISLAENVDNYYKPMKDFMSEFLRRNNRDPSNLERYEISFESVVRTLVDKLGPKPFHIIRGLNAAVYDSVTVAFSRHWESCPGNISQRYRKLLDNESYRSYISTATTDVDTVKRRIELAEQHLFG